MMIMQDVKAVNRHLLAKHFEVNTLILSHCFGN